MTKARDLANIISGGFTVDDIPNIPASKITSGTFTDDRLPATALNSNVDLTNLSASNLTSGTIPVDRITALPAGVGGKVLQIVSVTKTDTFTSSSSSFTDITGLTANITPASSSNKVYINLSVQGSQDVNANRVSYQLIRDNTAISVGDQAASRSRASSGLSSPHGDIIASSSVNVLDSPSTTSQITYKVRIANTAGTGNAFVNRTENDENGSGMPRYASTITLMEIAG